MNFNSSRRFTRSRLVRRNCYNQIWKYAIRQSVKKQNDITKKQYQGLDKVFEFNKKKQHKIRNLDQTKNRKSIKSNLFYSNKFTCFKYHNIEKFTRHSFSTKVKDVKEFKVKLELIMIMKKLE